MPYKHNESRRHKIPKSRYKVTNWHDYNNGLRQRGDVTIWFTEDAIADWRPAKTGARGRPQEYSDIAIETAVFIRQVFHLPLRQTEGFMNSLARAMKADITIPDFSSISKRSMTLPRHILTKAKEPGSIVIVDSTGLKVYGKDEWHQEKHAVPARRTWRRLHLAIDENHNVLACELTTPEVGDPTAVTDLLDQITTLFDTFMGDGAYDGEPVAQAVLNKQPNAQVVVPPHKNAVSSDAGDTQRDQHIQAIEQHGRIAWQQKTGYGLRNLVELAMQRHKRIFGNTLKARALPQQKTEAWISASALNRMTNLGMPVSVKI
jgi:Transposase DDE domain